VVARRKAETLPLSNHFAIIFALIFCAPCASICADGDKLKLGNITLAASSR